MSYFLKSQIFTYIFSPLYVVKHVLVDSLTCLTSLCLYRTHVPHQSVEESRGIIRTVFNNDTTWAIVWKETGEVVGAIGYGPSCDCNLPAGEEEPTVGYWVGRPYWNRGICSEALQAMIDRIRATTTIRSLISGHFVDNPASGRVMEKCGFLPTGDLVYDERLYGGKGRAIRVLRLPLCIIHCSC